MIVLTLLILFIAAAVDSTPCPPMLFTGREASIIERLGRFSWSLAPAFTS